MDLYSLKKLCSTLGGLGTYIGIYREKRVHSLGTYRGIYRGKRVHSNEIFM